MADAPSQARTCMQCEQEIREAEKFLEVSSADGAKHFVHTHCFTSTTFDPDRFAIQAPDSERSA